MIARRIAGIGNVADDLVDSQARFLEAGQDSRVGLIALLRHAQQRESRAGDNQENGRGDQQLQKREALLPPATGSGARLALADLAPFIFPP